MTDERMGFEEHRGHRRLLALAHDWRALAEDITVLAESHEQRYKQYGRDGVRPTFEDSYDSWLRQAAYIEAWAAELLAFEVHLARLRQRVSWRQFRSFAAHSEGDRTQSVRVLQKGE